MITFFKTVYRRHTNFAMESIQQTFNGTVGFGNTVRSTISRNGDLISGAYLEVTLPIKTGGDNADAWVEHLGHYLVKRVDVEIGGQLIDRHYGDWLDIWHQLTVNRSKAPKYLEMTSGFGALDNTGGAIFQGRNLNAAGQPVLYVPLQFWFCRNVGLALPLIALQYHEVVITLEIEQESNVFIDADGDATETGSFNVALWVDYIYLDTDERRRFAQVSHEYLIEQVQFQGDSAFSVTQADGGSQQITLNFNHPVKELVWASRLQTQTDAKRWNNFTTLAGATAAGTSSAALTAANALNTYAQSVSRNPTQRAILQLNGHDRFAAREGTYFNMVQHFEHHSGSYFSPGVNVYSFALKPEDHQPSGTCNFSRIDNARLNLTLSANGGADENGVTKVFAVNYNVLRIMSGMGGLAYSN
jgi:hypothetical protein